MRRTYAAAVLFAISIGVVAQNTATQSAKGQNPKGLDPPSAKTKLTEQQKRGLSLLESAEAAAGGMEAASRIVAYLQIAQVYGAKDKKKALELTERSYEGARTLQPDFAKESEKRVEEQLQNQVIDEYISLAPEKVDSDLDQMPLVLRVHALQSLLPYYWKNKNTDRPVTVLMQLALETEMEYDIATQVIEKLAPQHSEHVRELFVAALTSYQNHEHSGVSSGGFTETIAAAYGHVPDPLISSAIDEVLSQAKHADENTQIKNIQMGFGSKGALEFRSIYDLQLFSVLVVLQQIDPEKAKRLLNERQDVRTFASKYPEGVGVLRKSGPTSFMVDAGPEVLEQQRSIHIVEDSAAHPNDALANAALLSPRFALQAYIGIARENMKKNAAVAGRALGKAQEMLPKVPDFEQLNEVSNIIYLYEQLSDKDAARSAIEAGAKMAAVLYKQDNDASDPNTAPEAYWVSTKAWRNLVEAAYELDPNTALSLVQEIPDEQQRVFVEIALASRLLASKINTYDVAMSVHKQGGSWTMFSSPMEMNEQEKK